MDRAAMPETAINEDGNLGGDEDNIGSPSLAWQDWAVNPKSQSEAVKGAPHRQLSGRISPSCRPHSVGGRRRRGSWPEHH